MNVLIGSEMQNLESGLIGDHNRYRCMEIGMPGICMLKGVTSIIITGGYTVIPPSMGGRTWSRRGKQKILIPRL